MSQDFILDILKKNKKKWFSKRDLIPIVPFNKSCTSRSISRIVKFKNSYGVKVKKGKRNTNFIRFI